MAKINLPEDVAKKFTVAKKVSPKFYHCKLKMHVDLTRIKMPMAEKLAALEPPILLPKKKSEAK